MVPLEDYLDHAVQPSARRTIFGRRECGAPEPRAGAAVVPMENEVLRLHISGFRYADIATRLNKSPKSVDNALQRIRKKLTLLLNKSYER